MHLRKPSLFLRGLILGAQGVFYNLFCMPFFLMVFSTDRIILVVLSYLVSPRICHRFVGHLEEEAVLN